MCVPITTSGRKPNRKATETIDISRPGRSRRLLDPATRRQGRSSGELFFDEVDHVADVLERLELTEREADAELTLGFRDERDVSERVPARHVEPARRPRHDQSWIVENIAEDRLESFKNVRHLVPPSIECVGCAARSRRS